MTSPPNHPPLGTVLVTGGCGFLGSHIVRLLLLEPTCTSIHVLSRTPTSNLFPNVKYHSCSISNAPLLSSLLQEIAPDVIIHASSPRYNVSPKILYEANVTGTKHLLSIARDLGTVKAFVYASSDASMRPMADNEIMTEENVSVYAENEEGDAYQTTKGIADTMVRQANSNSNSNSDPNTGMRTACLRFGAVYGEGDPYIIPDALKQLRDGNQKVQIGTNKTLREWVYISSAASAHLLAAKALLAGHGIDGGPVAGEAFLISDGGAMPMYDFLRKVWREAGDATKEEDVRVLPMWVVMAGLGVVEWIYWIGTLGVKSPEVGRRDLRYIERPYWFDIRKAERRLGYKPLVDVDEGVRRAVKWALDEEKKRKTK
ncbi:C-3 sterol dehydrogenase/C-4 decarboxylase [Rhexocercosporidium sp. MPI-PUGE-AT-0058]|nr:C-3 sterol dehydrogenase/C-4 decarboxylase [Rhexocercosporidium sp. MPI-PUGE-AT-0058]